MTLNEKREKLTKLREKEINSEKSLNQINRKSNHFILLKMTSNNLSFTGSDTEINNFNNKSVYK